MPCFLGLAVSIHTPSGPLPEYSIQKQSKFHRITSYIPVPPARISPETNKPEQSTFAISITLLTPGLNVPYSTPKPTPEEPNPRPKIVGGLPGGLDRTGLNGGRSSGPVIAPYKPLTSSPNETIAAYIYFDGRAKEEVATLLRRGEETWVNSRWVSVPASEGGGLAEREFLFREVGLERWLNGLDLEGKDVAARIERRKQRLEKKRRKRREAKGSDDEDDSTRASSSRNGILRYGDSKEAPVEALSGNEDFFTSDSDSEDEPPVPEAAGQIKVALYRVLASGEIKRGEYSPQFDAHDDDDGTQPAGGEGDDVDHTTSFAKPKSLDPKSISTQTVTGIDPPDKPYAVFTFLYRGERQLRKMGILPPEKPIASTAATARRRRSTGLNFGDLKPLNPPVNAKNFSGYRDPSAQSPKSGKKSRDTDAMDSDADDEDEESKIKVEDMDDDRDTPIKEERLSPEDAARTGELTEGVRKIKLKRQHSAEPVAQPSPGAKRGSVDHSPLSGTPVPSASEATAASSSSLAAGAEAPSAKVAKSSLNSDVGSEPSIGSPFKKQRASLPGFDEGVRKSLGAALMGAKERGLSEGTVQGGVAGSSGLDGAFGATATAGALEGKGQQQQEPPLVEVKMEEEEEEL
ncbi:uncharacterized protein EI97DRAFT_447815 [Westerdykella ornata]|uniref:DUF7918 domain-containing protein n=1 Tax=Westerdykella ornata TaxID=318751 RepID=A0A6A6JVJ9_WESOR|nr:uncharacterized protein EI97DRAFT_447815 [Westerdykella ornata]KAF2280255.1 hypothetical protein EI97DRAFT_447815 [Westerdykella ornata]